MKDFNFGSKTSWWIAEQNMVIFNGNVMHQSDNGKRDAIGRTWDAYYAYRDKRFLDGIMSCWMFDGNYWRGRRFPLGYQNEVPMSRDHVYNTIYALHLGVQLGHVTEEFYEHFISHQPRVISSFAKQTLTMWLYIQLLNKKKIGWLFYPIEYASLKVYKQWNKLIYKLTGVGKLGGEIHQDNFKPILEFPRAKVLDWVTGLLYPNYALMSVGHRIQLLDNKKWLDKIKKAAWPLIPTYNYVGILLFNHPDGVTQEEVRDYKPMIGDRWSDILNPWINYGRNIHKLDKKWLGENELDKDLLIKLNDEKKSSF